MRVHHPRSTTRGFTLVEMVVVVGVVAIMGTVAVNAMTGARHNAALRSAAREVIGDLRQSRTMSVTRKMRTGDGIMNGALDSYSNAEEPNFAFGGPDFNILEVPPLGRNAVVVVSELLVLSPTSYALVNTYDSGDRNIEQMVDFTAHDPESAIRILTPPVGESIRFRGGVRTGSSQGTLELEDQRTRKRTIVEIGASGMRVRN